MADEPPAAGASGSPGANPPEQNPTTPPDTLDLLASLTGANAPDPTAASSPTAPPQAPAPDGGASNETILPDQAMIDELLKQAEFEDPSNPAVGGAGSAEAGADPATAPTEPFDMPNFQQVMADAQVSSIDLLRDVELNVKIELGRSRMLVEDVLKLGEGSVVEVGKLAGDRVDVCVKGRLVARGELRVLPDNFGWPVHGIAAAV